MAFDQYDVPDHTGNEPNLWASIYRAFCLIDTSLTPTLFIISSKASMASMVEVTMLKDDCDGNQTSITSTKSLINMERLYEIITSSFDKLDIIFENIMDFVIKFQNENFHPQWKFVIEDFNYENDMGYYFLRFNKKSWHAYVGRNIENSFLNTLASLSLRMYSLYKNNLWEIKEFIPTEREILLRSAWKFSQHHAKQIGIDKFSWGKLLSNLDQHSMLRYEKNSLQGCLILISENTTPEVIFKNPISLSEYRFCRKALEMSRQTFPLLSDGNYIFGFMSRKSLEVLEKNSVSFSEIIFLAHHWWHWKFRGQIILEFRDGIPRLPKISPLHADMTKALSSWPKIKQPAKDRILGIIDVAANWGRGALIVISKYAAKEAVRLNAGAIQVQPLYQTIDSIQSMLSIDGAILVDLDGKIHSAGVIIDGFAGNFGDPARGSRFNSALRYQRSRRSKTVIVVLSSDGSFDVIY